MENYDEYDQIDIDISDCPDLPIDYQVWLIGYENDKVSGFTYLIDNFDTAEEAIKCGKFFNTMNNILLLDHSFPWPQEMHVEVESVVDTDAGEINIGSVYEAPVNMCGYWKSDEGIKIVEVSNENI